MSSANNRTQAGVWGYLHKNGPQYPRDIRIGRTKHAVYQAIQNLLRKGLVQRTADSGGTWHIRYEIVPGSTPPNDMRGMSPGSRKALYEAAERHGRGILKRGTAFTPCALAECWKLLPVSRASIGGED